MAADSGEGSPKAELVREGLGHLLADRHLRVPFYQRAYKWEKSHIDELFEDLRRAIDNNQKSYFLGSIVACPGADEALEIVDGQQRLATTAILLAAMRNYLLEIDNKEGAAYIHGEYLAKKRGIKQDDVPSLTLGETDNDYFRKRIIALPKKSGSPPAPSKPSHVLIDLAAKRAATHVQALTANLKPGDAISILDRWEQFLRDKAQVIFIEVQDHADAFVIFETLNDRGLELSIADLTKNYVFGRSGKRVEEVKQSWARMTGILEAVSDEDITKHYIHQLWSSLYGVTRSKELFKSIREKIHAPQSSVDLTSSLADSAQMYAALRNPAHEYWNPLGVNAKRHIQILESQLRVSQIRMLLLAVLNHFEKNEIKKVLPYAVAWSVRFLIAGGSPGNLESYYATRAVRIRRGELSTAAALAKSMRDVVPNDEIFHAAFATASATTPHLARYYLKCLENTLDKNEKNPHLATDDEVAASVEHVLPKSPSKKEWKIDPDDASRLRWRIGNLALLSAEDNSERGNDSFKAAKKVYTSAPFVLTQEVADFKDWGEESIRDRQNRLADLAVKAWPI